MPLEKQRDTGTVPCHEGRPHVLVVDDERTLAEIVASYLEREGFAVTQVYDGLAAVRAARETDPVLVVLDVMLPGLDGYEVARQLRTFTDAYILMLTARGEEMDAVIGLSSGADDYLVKPFGPRELVARVKALLRRPRTAPVPPTDPEPDVAADRLAWGPLTLDPTARLVDMAGQAVDLTRVEFDILAALMTRPRAALTRQQILDAAWGSAWAGDEHTVDVHIGHIRAKIDPPEATSLIRTVRGIGYGMAPL